jgi:hypothetical protein
MFHLITVLHVCVVVCARRAREMHTYMCNASLCVARELARAKSGNGHVYVMLC